MSACIGAPGYIDSIGESPMVMDISHELVFNFIPPTLLQFMLKAASNAWRCLKVHILEAQMIVGIKSLLILSPRWINSFITSYYES